MKSSSDVGIEKELEEMEQLARSGLEIKGNQRNKGLSIWTFNLSIPQEMSEEFARIKIAAFTNSSICKMMGFPYYYLTITKQNDDERYYVVKQDTADSVLALVKQIAEKLPNNCLEMRQIKRERLGTRAFPDYYWSNLGPWAKESANEDSYINTIDPIMIDTFKKMIIEKRPQTVFTVIDAGGGKGRLAKKFIEAAEEMGVTLNYALIEPDQSQCEEAQKVFAEMGSDAKVFRASLDQFRSSPDFENYKNSADFVISSGGPLNLQVVSRDDAIANLDILRELLNEDGCIIAAGKSKLALKKKEMEKQHFDVLQTHVKEENGEDRDNLLGMQQVYVLRKSKDEKEENRQDTSGKNRFK